MEDKLLWHAEDGIDMNNVLDIVLDNLEDILSMHIPPNTSTPSSQTNSIISPIMSPLNSINNCITNNNNNNINNISVFLGDSNGLKPELKDHIFISKDCTYRLSQYVTQENWGRDGVLLYKYLDYIFRCQCFDKQIIKIMDNKNNKQMVIFHTGLQRRYDNEYLYVILHPNYISVTHKNKQKWRVQFGNISDSFVSKNELLMRLKQLDINNSISLYLPQKTIFSRSICDCMYNPRYSIEVSWEERLLTNQDRIYKVIGCAAFFDNKRKHLKLTQLIHAFDNALNKTKQMLTINPTLICPQGFVDTKRQKYRQELLLPLFIYFNNKIYTFALAIALIKNNNRKNRNKNKNCNNCYYSVKSVLTLQMAYANARLIGPVQSNWLKN